MLIGAEKGDMAMSKKSKVTASSGNVFVDLGIIDAEEALAKAEIVSRICDIIAERKLSQTKAAALLGIDQPKISSLMRGRLEGFSADRLFRFLNALDRDVEIFIKPKEKNAKHGRIHVMAA
jgi:predicted XRE-type DNA-binding protein